MKCPTAINEVHIKSPIICFIDGNSPSRHIQRGVAFSRIQILILIPPLKIAGLLLVPFFSREDMYYFYAIITLLQKVKNFGDLLLNLPAIYYVLNLKQFRSS